MMKTNIFENSGRLTVEQLESLKKKIPIRGLNNLTKEPWWFKDSRTPRSRLGIGDWKGKPTLPRRMNKLLFGLPYLPPQMVAMGATEGTHNDEAKLLLANCFSLLEDLKNNLDDVTIIQKEDVERYKIRIENLVKYLRTSGRILGLIIETEFRTSDENTGGFGCLKIV